MIHFKIYQDNEIKEVTNIKFVGLGLDKHGMEDSYLANNSKNK
jgi:hypothetical protein